MKQVTLILMVLILGTMGAYTQSTTTGHTPGGTRHLGWDDILNTQLRLTQNNTNRMLFNSQVGWTGLNGANNGTLNVNRITIPHDGSFSELMPAWSMLHLWEDGLPAAMRRDWMNIGLSMTGNSDLLYLGMMERPAGISPTNTDMVMAWGCQDGVSQQDNFRFIFMDLEQPSPMNDDNTVQGREIMRLSPSGKVGIGDFSTMTWPGGAGLAQQPTHKLDVDGTARLRQMIAESPDVLITGVEQNTTGDYELQYKALSGDPDEYLGGDGNWYELDENGDCDWESSGNDIFMGTTTSCATGNAAIGQLPIVNSRLSITEVADDGETNEYGQRIAISGFEPGITFRKYGIESFVEDGALKFNIAVYGESRDADYNYGIYGKATGGSNTTATNYAVYGTSLGANPALSWAGYFAGKVYASQGFSGSDENLKQNIVDIEGAVDILQQIDCKTYQFRTEEYPQLNLPEGSHLGVIAQNLEEVLPNLVTEIHHPEQFDQEGNLTFEALDFKGVDYNQLIPILIQATKEQQAEMDAKNDRIDDLEAQIQSLADMVAQCCADQAKSNQNNQGANDIQIDKNLLKQNTPNPFDLNTTIEYYLAQAGKVTIKVTNAQGQLIDVLVSEDQDQGSHEIQWTAKNITRGVYYYSLTINGEEMVKRMVKL